MEVTSSLNNHTFNTTIFAIVGPVLLFQKQTVLLFFYHIYIDLSMVGLFPQKN